MARSWERMVQRNSKQVNKRRKQEGKTTIGSGSGTKSASSPDVFKGRSIGFPAFLVALGTLYLMLTIASPLEQGPSALNWVGVSLYYLLAVFMFFRRPYLKVDRSSLATIRFNRERVWKASDIEIISLSKGAVTVKMKGKRTRWVFTKLVNRYDIPAMSARLEQFAKAHNVNIEHL